MFRLISAEVYKLFKIKTFKVLCFVAILSALAGFNISSPVDVDRVAQRKGALTAQEKLKIVEALKNNSKEGEGHVVKFGRIGYDASEIKDLTAPKPIEIFHVSFGNIGTEVMIIILVASVFAGEYNLGTFKNTLAYGKRRESFYIAKFLAITFGVAILTIIITFLATFFMILYYGGNSGFGVGHFLEMISILPVAVIVYSGVVAMIMLVSLFTKSNFATSLLCIAIFIFMPMVSREFYGMNIWLDKIYEITPYYNTSLVTAINSSKHQLIQGTLVGFAFTVIMLIIGILVFKRQDIK